MEFEKIAKLLAEIMGWEPEDLSARTELTSETGIHPVNVARLVIDCERKFKIKIWDEDVHRLRTLGAFAEYVGERMEQRDVGMSNDKDRTGWYYR